ncbi:universal stress protein [Halopiger goleimassiliensis]|uniref:universal stress protein n=1 Tax=Halopiger goleimassiliensis TaxID=1293048 RepID=UPI00067778CA|nr:universal stress protein [Halopiger goleimassiliensis]
MSVLVAYDGSAPAQDAATYAFEEYPDEEIVLLRVLELAEGYTGAGVELAREALGERTEEADEELLEEVTDLAGSSEAAFRTEVRVGDPAHEVVEFAGEHDVDHIVVGNHGRTGVSRVLLGSVAEKIVRRAPVPVTVVR